jgi:hypothetical protein
VNDARRPVFAYPALGFLDFSSSRLTQSSSISSLECRR